MVGPLPPEARTQCRRFPPHPHHGWPHVQGDDWCSEWAQDI